MLARTNVAAKILEQDSKLLGHWLETDAGFIAIETKLSAAVRKSDIKGIKRFARQVEKQFRSGI